MSKIDEFDVVIRHKNGTVIAGIPQLGLFAKADDPHAALTALDAKKKAYLADLEEAGELGILDVEDRGAPVRRVAVAAARPAGDLLQFAIKAGIVVFLVVVTFVTSGVLIASTVERSIDRTVSKVKSIKIGGSQFWTQLENELDRMARPGNDLPEAKKQKLLADIRMIGAKWSPFLTELQAALSDAANPPPPSGAPK